MTAKEELELVIKLLGKYNLPLSPILKYAIKEKIEQISEDVETKQKIADNIILKPNKVKNSTNVSIINEDSKKNEVNNIINTYYIESKGNHCALYDNNRKVFSSSGKLLRIGNDFYRIYITYYEITINRLVKDRQGMFVLGDLVLNAHFRSPFYASVNGKNYSTKIKEVKFNNRLNVYCVKIDDKWFGINGDYVDVEKSDVIEPSLEDNKTEQIILDDSIKRPKNKLEIVELGERSFAVIGDTEPIKDELKSLGGCFTTLPKWGAVCIFPSKMRIQVQRLIKKNTKWNLQRNQPLHSLLYVEFPNGKVSCNEHVWETMVDVVMYAGPERVKALNIIHLGDNLISSQPHKNPIYRAGQRKIDDNLYISTYSSTETKYRQLERINTKLGLGLYIEIVDSLEDVKDLNKNSIEDLNEDSIEDIQISDNKVNIEDKKIGYEVVIFPSHKRGKVINERIDKWGSKKLIVKTTKGDLVEIYDSTYYYKVISKS